MSLQRNNVAQIHSPPRPLHISKDTKTKSQQVEMICILGQKRKKSIFSLNLSHLVKHTFAFYDFDKEIHCSGSNWSQAKQSLQILPTWVKKIQIQAQ